MKTAKDIMEASDKMMIENLLLPTRYDTFIDLCRVSKVSYALFIGALNYTLLNPLVTIWYR